MGLSVTRIGAVNSAYGASGVSQIGTVEQKPINYAIDNQSEVSGAFKSSLVGLGRDSVTGAAPVQYPTAQIETNRINQVEKNQEANRAFNAVAGAHLESVATYNAASMVQSYGMVGSQVDLFA